MWVKGDLDWITRSSGAAPTAATRCNHSAQRVLSHRGNTYISVNSTCFLLFFAAKFPVSMPSISIHSHLSCTNTLANHRQGTAAWNSMASRFAYFVPGLWPCKRSGDGLECHGKCHGNALVKLLMEWAWPHISERLSWRPAMEMPQCLWSIRTYRNIRLLTIQHCWEMLK